MADERSSSSSGDALLPSEQATVSPTEAPTAIGEPTPATAGAPPAEPSLAGTRLGPYLLHRLLGRGGMGEVYEAEHVESGRRVALKLLSQSLAGPEDHARFLREGRLAAAVSHPNSVYVYGTEEIDGTPVITMELATGGTLSGHVRAHGPMPPAKAVDTALQAIAGLEAAAALGVLHRDIKPSNCFLDRGDAVKVGDFGLSVSTLARAESHLTVTGTFLGTPSYASPEQVRCEDLDVRSDIYSVGATVYFLLTGRAPFEDTRMTRLLAAVLERTPEPPRRFHPETPAGLERAVMRCLEKDPARRYPDYASLRAALLPFSSTAPAPAGLALRAAAYLMDSVVVSLGVVPLTYFRGSGAAMGFDPVVSLASSLLMAAYFGVLEGLWGASVGKRLCGLRVVGPDCDAPGLPRGLLRAFVFTAALSISDLILAKAPEGTARLFLQIAIQVVVILLLFAAARRRNGFAALHDRASKTRVVVAPETVERAATQPATVAPTATSGPRRVGPYAVLGTLSESDGGQLLLGYDEQLRRETWVEVLPAGAPPVRAERRDLARPGRLRWLSGRRSDGECWDAWEAPGGRALADLQGEHHPWAEVRRWLLDIATELETGGCDSSLPAALGLDRVWIGADGHARLLDFPAPAQRQDVVEAVVAVTPLDEGAAQALLRAVAATALAGPRPLHASAFLRDLENRELAGVGAVAARLREIVTLPAAVSRQRRLAHLGFCALMLGIASVSQVAAVLGRRSWEAAHPDAAFLAACLDRIERLGGKDLAYRAGREAGRSTGTLLWPSEGTVPTPAGAARGGGRPAGAATTEQAFERRRVLLELYLAARHRQELEAGLPTSNPHLQPSEKEKLGALTKRVLERYPSPPEDEVVRAEAELTPYLDEVRKALARRTAAPPLAELVVQTGNVVSGLGLFGILSALLFRGGLLLRLLGIAVVNEDGAHAGRIRAARRALVAWSPALLGLAAVLANLAGVARGVAGLALHLPPLALLAAGALYAARHPERGLQDRTVKTYLVPR